jgi:lipoprotein signal peptidase
MESRYHDTLLQPRAGVQSGRSFSFLAGAGGWQKWFFVASRWASRSGCCSMLRQHATERLLPTALALILGGALGNVIDRLRFDAWSIFSSSTYAGWYIGRLSTWPIRPSPSAWR